MMLVYFLGGCILGILITMLIVVAAEKYVRSFDIGDDLQAYIKLKNSGANTYPSEVKHNCFVRTGKDGYTRRLNAREKTFYNSAKEAWTARELNAKLLLEESQMWDDYADDSAKEPDIFPEYE